jgi:hypothetical protein
MEYYPVGETLINKQLGQNITVAILEFPDNRPPVKGFAYSKKLLPSLRRIWLVFFLEFTIYE